MTLRVNDDVRHLVTSVDLVVREGAGDTRIPMSPTWRGYECSISAQGDPHVAFYHFEVMLSDETACTYGMRDDGRSTAGELKPLGEGPVQGFQISMYEPSFATPDWLAGSIMYQVFPDRFARGASGVRADGVSFHESMGRPVHLQGNWNKPIAWDEASGYDPVEFYGGTLQGIREKLPYLASLGVEVLYLNPVFEARSNHRYDTADYEHIDPLLGTDGEFEELCRQAAAHGISVVLDAVLSHTGSDSRYFNAMGAYDDPGAAQGPESPYYTWFDFTLREGGVPYRCWWDDPTLPEVDERNDGWQRYILDGILPKWLASGARGYRLDVADEIPDEVLERLRTSVKAADGQAAIIGEVWEDATTKESYGVARTYALGRALDSVMNYPLREALIGFATGVTDAYQLATFLKLQQSNYPEPLYRCLMNLLSSHDVDRIRTVLAFGGSIRNETRDLQAKLSHSITPAQDARAARLHAMVAGLLYALPGAPCIYYGDERGMQGGSDPFCRAPMVWGNTTARSDAGEDMLDYYRHLGHMRKHSAALRNGAFSCIAASADVLCVVRVAPDGQTIVAVANRSDERQRVVVDFADPALNLPPCVFTSTNVFESIEGGLAILNVYACSTAFLG